ncbi:hypothetical protein PR202_ga12785 [Eleusine coracana subsp. coracana]|uniref:Uncharacterized protein n=1 Tax=Eleusine coracana subsp. coracana TaxID=191504 RepID=A0AAV5CCJ7_ELECO|nr:hypothetical protein PR202_ga12785 [Eleusine coracana subsp. coracana]
MLGRINHARTNVSTLPSAVTVVITFLQLELTEIQVEYLKDELRNLARELLHAQEMVTRIMATTLCIGQFLENTYGGTFYVQILSTIDREPHKPSGKPNVRNRVSFLLLVAALRKQASDRNARVAEFNFRRRGKRRRGRAAVVLGGGDARLRGREHRVPSGARTRR